MINKKEWWQFHFNQNYIKTYVDIVTPAKTKEQIEFLVKNLKLSKSKKVLDLACGYGRHAIPLARLGFNITGFDYSKEFILIANKIKKSENLNNVSFVQGDMRNLKYKDKFDVIINLFTSFGYFDDESENLMVLKGVYRSLKPKGIFLIDLNNEASSPERIKNNGKFIKKTGLWKMISTDRQSNGLFVKTTQELDALNRRLYMSREWKEGGEKKSYNTSLRMYSFPELKFLLELAGFKFVKVWGGFDGQEFSIKSRRMIILAKKMV